MENIMKLVSNNQHLAREIYRLKQEIIATKQVIRENEKVIWRNCKHQWVYDDSCGPYERIKYRCSICDLWQHSHMYS